MIAIAMRRKPLVHEVLCLRRNRQGVPHERREPPLRGHRLITVPQYALGCRTEYGRMVGKCGRNIAEKIRALGQDMIPVAIQEPIFPGRGTVDHLLQA